MRKNVTFLAGACAVALAVAALTTLAQPAAPPTHVLVTPADIVWGPAPPSLNPAAKLAVLFGNPGESGPFVIRLHAPAGFKVAPHWHPTAEHVTVLSGTFAVGMGESFDEKGLHDLPPGGFVMLPAEMRHFAMAKTDIVIQVHGTGPFVLNYVNPADDPRQQTKPQ